MRDGDLAVGSYPGVTGAYSGDGTYAGSTSTNSVDLTVGAGGGSSLLCRKIYGHLATTVVVTKCGAPKRSAHFAGGDLLTGGTLTWGKTTATTTYTATAESPGRGACLAGRTEYDVTGSVTADASGLVTVGDAVTYSVCVNSNGVVNLIKRTTASF